MANYNAVTQQAQNVAATPYQGFGGELVAGINNQQNTGIGAVNAASGIQNPYNAGAASNANASAGAIDPTQFSPSQIAQYESPYQSDVINATEAEIQNQNQQQQASLRGNAISSGSFGGDRAGIAQSALAGQQDIANNATLANLNNQNYGQAMGEFNTQQGVNLGARQNTAQRQLAASGMLGQLGQTAQGEALTEANAQTNAGTLQQTTRQAQDTAAYNQFLQRQAYPFETTGWLANIVEGIGSQSGGSSSGQTTTQGGSGASQIGGALLGLASFLARGGRVPHRAAGGGIYLPQFFDPTAPAGPMGVGGGGIVPTTGQLAVGHTMPTQGAPAPIQPPTPQQDAQSMSQMAKAVQGAGKGIGNAFTNSPLGDAYNDTQQDAEIAAAQGGVLPGGDLLGAGGIGAMARGGIVGRPHFEGGGDAGGGGGGGGTGGPGGSTGGNGPGGGGDAGSGGAPGVGPGGSAGPMFRGPTPMGSVSWGAGAGAKSSNPASYPAGFLMGQSTGIAPTPVGTARPAGAASYSVFPQQMSDGSFTTTQNLAQGIAPLGSFAQGGIVGRPHYDDGGIVPTDPAIDLSPESLLAAAETPPTGLAAASQLAAPQMGQQQPNVAAYANQMPAPNVAHETPTPVGIAAQMPSPVMADNAGPTDIPIPPVRPDDLGATPDVAPPMGLVGSSPRVASTMGGIQPGGDPIESLKNSISSNIESGGNYQAIGPKVKTKDGVDHAYGKFQVMGNNIPSWTQEILGQPMTPAQFLADPKAQEAVASAKLGQYFKQTGSLPDTASMWFTGRTLANGGADATDVNGMTGAKYAQTAVAGLDPLAYDSVGRRGGIANAPAAAAIDNSAAPAGIVAPPPSTQVSAPQFPDHVPTPESGKTGLFGLNLSPDTRQLMLSAGMGIMGGTSMNPWINVGQGALTGIAATNANRKTNSEIGLQQAQTQGAQIENQMKAQRLKLMMDALNGHADSVSSAASGAPSPTTPTVTAPGVTAGSGAGAGAAAGNAAPQQLDPNFDPAVIARQINAEKWVDPQAAAADRERLNQIVSSGRSRDINGNIVNLPGFADAEAQVAGEKEFAQGNAKNATAPAVDPITGAKYVGGAGSAPTTGAPANTPEPKPFAIDPETAAVSTAIPNAPKGGGYIVPNLPAGARMTELPESTKEQMKMDAEFQKDQVSTMRATPTVIARTQAIAQAFKTFQSGSLTDKQHDAAALAVALGQPTIAQKIMGGSISGPEWVDKEGVQSVLDTLKSATPRFAQSEFNAVASHGTPNTTNQPQANHEMVAEMLALGERNDAFMKDWESAKQKGWASPSAFYEAWDKSNPINGFIKSAQRQIGNFAGMDLPKPADWAAGSVYVAPAKLPPATGALLGKYGIKPGSMFRYNGRNAAQPVAPIDKSDYFSAQLGQ